MTLSGPDKIVYTRREAAKIARMGIASFDEAVRRGDFPSIRVGRRILIPRVAFEGVLSGELASKRGS